MALWKLGGAVCVYLSRSRGWVELCVFTCLDREVGEVVCRAIE